MSVWFPSVSLALVSPANPCSQSWYGDILNSIDHEAVDSYRAKFLGQLRDLAAEHDDILKTESSPSRQVEKIAALQLTVSEDQKVSLEDLRCAHYYSSCRYHWHKGERSMMGMDLYWMPVLLVCMLM